MSGQLNGTIVLPSPDGGYATFAPGTSKDDLPDWALEKIGAHAFDDGDQADDGDQGDDAAAAASKKPRASRSRRASQAAE